MIADICIIGAGIIGCATARELSKYALKVMVLEKEAEVSTGASKANSGIVHAGYDCKPGSLKARFNVEGNMMYDKLAKELDIPLRRNGAMVLAHDAEEGGAHLNRLLEQGKKNGVQSLAILTQDEVRKKEPNINDEVVAALYAGTSGIISPYEATVAFAENANQNGVNFIFDSTVTKIEKCEGHFKIYTNDNNDKAYEAAMIINAAGVFSDAISAAASSNGNTHVITPRKGEYVLFDISSKGLINSTLFQLPSKFGKGVLVTPTVHGNLLIGPSAEDMDDKNDTSTHGDILQMVLKTGGRSIKSVPHREIITSFAGLRASTNTNANANDFIIEESSPGFINALGIDSPGLSAAPAIARHIAELVNNRLQPAINRDFIPQRAAITIFRDLPRDKQNALIAKNPSYGRIVCRCETVTEGEIIDAINRPLGAVTMDGVKRRTRAGMGRCQAGFCTSRVIEILARELNIREEDVTKFGKGSRLLAGGGRYEAN